SHFVITVAKDQQMQEYFREHSYELMQNGEGAISYHFRQRRKILFRFDRLSEVRRGEGEKHSVRPYRAWLSADNILELTAVTPAPPKRDPFSEWAWRVLLEAALGSPIAPAELTLGEDSPPGTKPQNEGPAIAGIPDQ